MHVSYIVNSIFNSRTYILSEEGSDEVWLVDCGDASRVLSKLRTESQDQRVVGVWRGDATIDEISQSPLQPRTNEINFADRYSFAVIEGDEFLKQKTILRELIGLCLLVNLSIST